MYRHQFKRAAKTKIIELLSLKEYLVTLTLLHTERPKLYTILDFLGAIGLTILQGEGPEHLDRTGNRAADPDQWVYTVYSCTSIPNIEVIIVNYCNLFILLVS